jgi:hypothetical protein
MYQQQAAARHVSAAGSSTPCISSRQQHAMYQQQAAARHVSAAGSSTPCVGSRQQHAMYQQQAAARHVSAAGSSTPCVGSRPRMHFAAACMSACGHHQFDTRTAVTITQDTAHGTGHGTRPAEHMQLLKSATRRNILVRLAISHNTWSLECTFVHSYIRTFIHSYIRVHSSTLCCCCFLVDLQGCRRTWGTRDRHRRPAPICHALQMLSPSCMLGAGRRRAWRLRHCAPEAGAGQVWVRERGPTRRPAQGWGCRRGQDTFMTCR